MEIIQNYLNNGAYAIAIIVILAIFVLILVKNQLKRFVASAGYREKLTDASFSEHENREVIFENEKVTLLSGVSFKTFLYYFAIIMSTLISPFVSLAIYIKYKHNIIKDKLKKINSFKVFKIENEDSFINYLNENTHKINLLINEMTYASYSVLLLGVLTKSLVLVALGLIIPFANTLLLVVLAINIYSYKLNYKYIEFYQLIRLIANSPLKLAKSEAIIFGLISSLTTFISELQGFSVYFWSILIVRFFITYLFIKVLEREDNTDIRHQEIENREYTILENVASYPNPKSQSRGYKFTSLLQMKFFEIEKKGAGKALVHIDNYAFYPQTVNRTDLRKNPLLKETLQKSVKTYIESLDITRQVVCLGGMGSGKTEMLNYIIEQIIGKEKNGKFNYFKSIVYNDTKGDFSKNFYREDKDILVNLYDERASVWCPFKEMNYNIESGTAFITNLFESIAGKEKDFFNASAKMKTATWLQESFFATNNNIDAWNMFFKKIKEYELEIKNTEDKTQSSILATIQIALEILYIMYFQIVTENRKTFTFNEFVYAENVQLFFVNNKQYEAKLTPYLTGLMATYINTGMSKEDTKEHLIFNAWDEFLTIKFDEETRRTLLTATRSKGFANWIMAQYLPKDEKFMQELDSSKYALITFNINDDFTLEKVAKKIADAEMLQSNSNPQEQQQNQQNSNMGHFIGLSAISAMFKNGEKYKLNYSLGNTKVILEQQLQSMPKFHHLTFIPSEEVKVFPKEEASTLFRLMCFGYESLMQNLALKNDFLQKESGILYLGYTPQSKLSYENKSFEKWDMKSFYDFKLTDKFKPGSTTLQTTITMTEKEKFKHWLNLKFIESDEDVVKYLTDNNLLDKDIDTIFVDVEENNEKVLKLISKYNELERYNLMNDFFDIELSDSDKKYEFCKKYDLIGGILGIFTFSDEFRDKLLNGEIL